MTKENYKKPLFTNLESEMAKQGLNITTLSNLIGMTTNQLSNRLRGVIEFRLNELIKVSEVMDKEINYLFSKQK